MTAPAGVVDTHHHVWDLAVRDHAWLHEPQSWADEESMAGLRRNFTLADLEPEAAAAGVGATVVVQTDIGPGETGDLLALAASNHLLAAVVGWTDLASPDVADAIAELRERPGGGYLTGIRHPVLAEPDADWLRRPDVLRGLAAVGRAGLVYDVVTMPWQLPGAVAAARARPEVTFVLDHVGNPDGDPHHGPWARAFQEMAALPNTVCKLSGILTGAFTNGPATADVAGVDPLVRGYYQVALEAFGPDRLMFGSDWPVCTLASPYQDVLAAARLLTSELSHSEQEAIFASTGQRVYRLTR